MTDGEKSVWFEEFGTPRECSVVVTPQAFVIHLVARPPERSGDVPGRLLLHAFTVRSDGTAVAAQVSARPGDREDLLFEQLDRLVLDLPHPGRP